VDDLSDRQRAILDTIMNAVETHGYPPTVREIGEVVGLSSPASVHNHLRALEERGYIRRGASKRRALEVLDGVGHHAPGRSEQGSSELLPLVGRVAAGRPILAEQNVEDMVEVPGYLAPTPDCFVLRVRGSSMMKAGIIDGDLVVVRRQQDAANGDVVVALLDDEATVKRFFREADLVRLQPENDAMEPLLVRDPRILGKVVAVMRRL
jgi:repressor LexA